VDTNLFYYFDAFLVHLLKYSIIIHMILLHSDYVYIYLLQEGIQKALDEQMDTLVLKLQQFELEMEQMWKELETKLESLKEKENTMEIKEKRLEKEKEQLLADRDSLETEISQQELRICQKTENLKLTQDERSEHSRLQLELKQEIEHSRM